MVDPDTDSLLLYDGAQSIYGNGTKKGVKLSLSSLGIKARGRTTILRLNYRNTTEVLEVAYRFTQELMVPEEANEDGIPIVLPRSAGRHGPWPELVRLGSFKSEAGYIVQQLRALHEQGMPWKAMAVLYRTRFMGERMTEQLRCADIPAEWLNENRGKCHFDPDDDSVKVTTMHSSKGLEFPVVAIPGLGYMPYPQANAPAETRLLYVAMTRAMDRLLLTRHRNSLFAARIDQVLEASVHP